jgi:hypothetical protein
MSINWEVTLSNGEQLNNKQMLKKGDILPFRRLIKYAVQNKLTFRMVKIIMYNQTYYHLPTFYEKARYSSSDIPEKFWFSVTERFEGALGGGMKSVEKIEAISYRLGNRRIYHLVDDVGNIWQRISLLNETQFPCGITETEVDREYGE